VKIKAWIVTGHWSTRILDAETGVKVKDYPNLYIWGKAPSVIPNQADLLLVQQLRSNDGKVRFDQTAKSIDSFALVQLGTGAKLTTVATVRAPSSPPKISPHISNVVGNYYGSYPPGVGSSFEGIPRLTLADIDGDDLSDIELQNGQWIGWSTSEGKLVLKGPPSSH